MGVNKVAGYSQRGWLGTVGWWVAHTWGLPTPGGLHPTWDTGRTGGRLWRSGREGECWAGAVGRGQDRFSPGRGGLVVPKVPGQALPALCLCPRV